MSFTIGMVNYKSAEYLETQIRIYQEFGGEEFQIIIVDTSRSEKHFKQAVDIVSQFPTSLVRIYSYDPPGKYSSAAHGEGLQHIYKMVDTKYFITQDPDFFWVKPYFLSYLKEKLQKFHVVGAPYNNAKPAEWSGHPWFPTPFGAAHRVEDLRNIDADFRYAPNRVWCEIHKMYCIKDVGWQVREKLCNLPYYYFKPRKYRVPIGAYSFDRQSTLYLDRNLDCDKRVAYHLHRGTFEINASEGFKMLKDGRDEILKNLSAPEDWVRQRKRACLFFWNQIKRRRG